MTTRAVPQKKSELYFYISGFQPAYNICISCLSCFPSDYTLSVWDVCLFVFLYVCLFFRICNKYIIWQITCICINLYQLLDKMDVCCSSSAGLAYLCWLIVLICLVNNIQYYFSIIWWIDLDIREYTFVYG